MDKLACYRNTCKRLLTERAELMRSQPVPGEQVVCLFDEATDNYVLLRFGWVRGEHLHSVTLHLRLVGDKVHVEQDWTDDFLAELVDAGVRREDIVLAFTPPEMRRTLDYAVA